MTNQLYKLAAVGAMASLKEFIQEDNFQTRYVEPVMNPDALRLQLRMDYENTEGHEGKVVIDQMLDYFADDLADLLENGDTNSSDYLLRHMDGAKKRGRPPKDIQIQSAQLFRQKITIKDLDEYTLYIVLRVTWNGTDEWENEGGYTPGRD